MKRRDEALALLEQALRQDGQQLARYAWGVLRNQGVPTAGADVLEDIVGEAVLTATQIIRANDGRSPETPEGLRLWLRKIISLKSLEHLRRTTKERKSRAALDDVIDQLAMDEWTDLLEESELKGAVRSAIRGLKDREQQVLEMSILDGATSIRIADSLGLSANAVRKIKMRALKTLRKRLELLGG